MNNIKEGLILYHGSYCEVIDPTLEKCAKHKDFGQGFYLTTSEQQARKFISTSLKKAKAKGLIDENQNYGYITRYSLDDIDSLRVKEYTTADEQWLHCVAGHRKAGSFDGVVKELAIYDVIIWKDS